MTQNEIDDTQDLHFQAQLDAQQRKEQEQPIAQQLDLIAYKALGVAQALRDFQGNNAKSAIQRLIELANEYDTLRSKL